MLSQSAWFCRRRDRNIWHVFWFAVTIAVHLQNAKANIIHVSWKTFKLLYPKFIQDNVYQISSESTAFCRRYDKNILVCFFGSQCIKECNMKFLMNSAYRSSALQTGLRPMADCIREALSYSVFVVDLCESSDLRHRCRMAHLLRTKSAIDYSSH